MGVVRAVAESSLQGPGEGCSCARDAAVRGAEGCSVLEQAAAQDTSFSTLFKCLV